MKSQSVRLRLGQSEVAALARGEGVEEVVRFGPLSRFGCVIRPMPGAEIVSLAFADGILIFRVPTHRLADWADGDSVGLSEALSIGNGQTLRLLIEKDYACTPTPERV